MATFVVIISTNFAQGSNAPATESDLVHIFEEPFPTPDLTLDIKGELSEDLHRSTELVEYNKDDFAGVYVPSETQLVVVPSSDRGVELALNTFGSDPEVRIDRASLSLNEADEDGADLIMSDASFREKVWMWSVVPARSSLGIGVFRPLDDADVEALEEFASLRGISIDVYVDETAQRMELDGRQTDVSPFAGGFSYASAGQTYGNPPLDQHCTGGWGYSISGTDYMLTAGHCFPKTDDQNVYMWNLTSSGAPNNYIGHRSNTDWNENVGSVRVGSPEEYHGDVSLVNVSIAGKAAGDQIWWGPAVTTDKVPVSSRITPTMYDEICTSGAVSGSLCGPTIIATNSSFMVGGSDEYLRQGDRASSDVDSKCTVQGDSGAPVIYDHHVGGAETFAVAIGVVSGASHSGGASGCGQFFTGIEEAMQAWGGGIKFH